MAGPKIAYRTATVEQALPVSRSSAWAAVEAMAAARAGGVSSARPPVGAAEVVLSDEPPWRRVVSLEGGHPSRLCQTTITIRDDGDTCLVAWSCLVDPTGVEADALEGLVATVTADGSAQLEAMVGLIGDGT